MTTAQTNITVVRAVTSLFPRRINAPDSQPPAELDYELWLGPAPFRPYNENHVHYNFRFFWDYSGGQMTNWGAHHFDIAQWGIGQDGPVEIDTGNSGPIRDLLDGQAVGPGPGITLPMKKGETRVLAREEQ